MRIAPQIALLTLLTLALLGLALWARHQAMIKDLHSAFAVGLFSPIRAEYPSTVAPAQAAVVQRREQELKLRLEAEARRWGALAISLFAGSVLSLSGVLILGRRALKKHRASVRSHC
jgi:hypothetical protein